MKYYRLNPDIDPVGTKHYLTAGGINYPYHVIAIHGAEKYAPYSDPLIIAECRVKGIELANPFLTLPLNVFAEVFQYSDTPFWLLVKQTQPSEGHAESVPE